MRVVFENVDKKYGTTHAVKNLNLTIADGALHFLLGPSGCGKTTSLRMLAGLESVTSGRILFDDEDVTRRDASDRGIGMVFQNYALWPHMTVQKNIEYGLKLRRLGATETKRRVDEVLEITQLGPFVKRYPGQLSGGQQQRVALARALAIRPNVLLLDEPLSNLDAKLRNEMRDNITRIHRQTKITTVYVTHDQKEALSMGSHVSVMRAGELVQNDTPRGLYDNPATAFIASFIGETNLIDGTYRGLDNGMHVVATAAGNFRCQRCVAQFQEGQDVTLSLRPEALHLILDGATASGNVLEGQLEHSTYLGDAEQLSLKIGGISLRANHQHSRGSVLHEGQKLRVHVQDKDVLVLPREASLSSMT